MSHQPLPQETRFSGIANMSSREFQGKYVHFNVFPKSDDLDQRKVSKLLVHEIAPHHASNMPHETGLTSPEVHPPFQWQESAPLAHTSHATTHPFPIQISYLVKKASNPIVPLPLGQAPVLHQNHVQSSLQQSKDNPPTDLVTQHLQQQTLKQSQLDNT